MADVIDSSAAVAGADSPASVHPAYERMEAGWTLARDFIEGTQAMREKGETYLPKNPAEATADYELRLKLTTLYNGFKRTVAGMVGLVTQRDVELGADDNPQIIKDHWENIDGQGTHGAVFARRVLRDGLITGHAGILVDFPVVSDPQTKSRNDEQTLGVRPYWRMYRAEDIRSWYHADESGIRVLRGLILRENHLVRSGRFGLITQTEYRVYTRDDSGGIAFERWRVEDNTPKVVEGPSPIIGPREIPFVWYIAGEHEEPGESRPPLRDLADLNLAHYQVASDRRNLMRLGCIPVPVRIGYVPPPTADGTLPIGPNILQDVPQGGDFKWAEVTGSAFQPTGEELDRLERQMGAIGLGFLKPDAVVATTATGDRLDSTAQNASLSNAATSLGDALEQALIFHASYIGVTAGSVEVNREFERIIMAPAMIQALSQLETAGQLSLETFLNVIEAGHVLPPDFDVDEEVTRILQGVNRMIDAANTNGDGTTPSDEGTPGDQSGRQSSQEVRGGGGLSNGAAA